MHSRLELLRQQLSQNNIDSLFISNQYNVSYLTGFSGLSPDEREGFFFLTKTSAYLLTFPTYFGMFNKNNAGYSPCNITADKSISHHLSGIIKRDKVKSIGFEKTNLTLAEYESLKKKIPAKWIETEGLVEKLRVIKDTNEIESIRKAAKITDQAFEFIKRKIKKGMTEKDIALYIEFFLKKNADGIAFTPIVAFDNNAAIPHYIPSNNQQLTTNNLILLDFGAKVSGYCADMTRVIFFGKPSSQQIKIYNTILHSQEHALNALKAGTAGGDIDYVARKYIVSQGYPAYPHGLGHGVGLSIHEAPRLKKESNDLLEKNMIITVEPGIYLEDNCGVRIEDLVLIKEDNFEILSKSDKNITII